METYEAEQGGKVGRVLLSRCRTVIISSTWPSINLAPVSEWTHNHPPAAPAPGWERGGGTDFPGREEIQPNSADLSNVTHKKWLLRVFLMWKKWIEFDNKNIFDFVRVYQGQRSGAGRWWHYVTDFNSFNTAWGASNTTDILQIFLFV